MVICIVKRWQKSHGLPFCSWLKSSSLRSRRLEEVGERENGRARGRHARGESPSRAPVFSCATTKRLLRRLEIIIHRNCHTCQFFHFSSTIFASLAWPLFVEIQKFCHHNNETKPFDRLASYPCVGAGPSELGSEFLKRSRHLWKDKRSSRAPRTSHFLVDPSHGPFSFLEMLRSPIKIAPPRLLKFGQRAKFAWNKKNNNKWMNNERLELTNCLFVAAIQQSCD